MTPGARLLADGTISFALWAPRASSVDLHLVDGDIMLPMERVDRGYFTVATDRAAPGSRYFFRKEGVDYPDPASVSQPDGVHGASQVVDLADVPWTDAGFIRPSLDSLVIYELHVGTFTAAGTFAAATDRLAELSSLGITAVEVMPIAEFAGNRNWGYDGVAWSAAQSSYGGPFEFARFVDAAHGAGLAVLLDVVFNHFGPEGNYSGQFGDYTTSRHQTPWGEAINLDGAGSDEVRALMIACLDHWVSDCHVDGFRFDAVHEIHDESAVPFLSELADRFGDTLLIAESDLNDRRLVLPVDSGGRGMAAAWADDFHHSVHALLTGEREGYYADFGTVEHLARTIEQGWYYSWDYSIARRRRHGNDPSDLPGRAFVFCTQNHDQVGNRMLGERLRTLVGVEAERAARALLLLSPYVPLLFMGQEYGEERPFLYFVDHTDADLLAATREGRRREFAAFHSDDEAPDPGARETRDASVLSWPGESEDREL
ncbi:MAG TPA: malto-oligosyltrehalose trehalohydrolase, partial [Spirochaetia bacterium]|nr:malto-oligosyltrehalose trehalohydrolase [Spirochaetia bacterium]